jgi:hypothetical protein
MVVLADLLPSVKDIKDFASAVAVNPGPTVLAAILLSALSILAGLVLKVSGPVKSAIAIVLVVAVLGAGGYVLYQVVPTKETDTAFKFGLQLASQDFHAESRALNTYVGGVEGEATNHRILFRDKDSGNSVNAKLAVIGGCTDKNRDECVATAYSLPVAKVRTGASQHFVNDGPGSRIVVLQNDPSKNCTVFPDPPPSSKPKNYSGPDLCAVTMITSNQPRWWDVAWISTAWAQEVPPTFETVRVKLASPDVAVRAKGRADLQKAADAASLLDRLISEPPGDLRGRIVSNALIAGIYFGDDKWPSVTANTKTKIVGLLTDGDASVARYAKSVLRRYPEEAVLKQVSDAAAAATGEARNQLVVAASDIQYNLGVTKLTEARADAGNQASWLATLGAFHDGIKKGSVLTGDAAKDPDITKNYFGLALSTADNWSKAKPANIDSAKVRDTFVQFQAVVDPASYPYTEQVQAAKCVTNIPAVEDKKFDAQLGECLKFFR